MLTALPSIRRRNFLGLAAAGVVTASCSEGAEDGPRPREEEGAGTPGSFQESPMLADHVDAGDLPRVEERLPAEPYVVQPGALVAPEFVEAQPGTYGGTLQLAQNSPAGDPAIFVGINEPLVWAPGGFGYADGEPIQGNVAAGWEVNADQTDFTFHLREGLRWSDGELVTTEDVRFAFEDVLNSEQITPVLPLYLRAAQRPDAPLASLEVVDELTFVLRFDEPYGNFRSSSWSERGAATLTLSSLATTWSSSTRSMRIPRSSPRC